MLSFFRKHQKGFFIFTTVIIVASFTFFGTSGVAGSSEKAKETPLGKTLNGSVITKQRVDRMVNFISFSHLDLTDEKVTSPNWLNTGVLEKEFLSKPLGGLLAKEIFYDIQRDLSSILLGARTFRSYQHPAAPFLNAEAVWGQFAPDSVRLAAAIKETTDTPTLRTFDLLARLYMQHKSFPSVFLKRVLAYQQHQDGRIPEDRSLSYADVSLLGLHKAQDWLGRGYLRAAAQVIIHGSDYAQSLGINMTLAEAREQLLVNLQEGSKKGSKEISAQDLYGVFIQQVRGMGMDEGECLALYRDIALFERLMASASSLLTVDPAMLGEFYGFAKELATLEVFSLPEHLQIKDFATLLRLQVYIDAITPMYASRGNPAFPKEMLSLLDVEKKYSSLVQRDYEIEYKGFNVKKGAALIGLKETWNWQVSDHGWVKLQEKFPALSEREVETKEDRFVCLERIDSKLRSEVDQFAREEILKADSKRMKGMLSQMTAEKEAFPLSARGDGLPMKGLKKKKALVALLEEAALVGETSPSEEALSAKEALSFYSEDGETYYSIEVIRRAEDKKVLSFAEADEMGLLTRVLEKKLEAVFPKGKRKTPASYIQADGSYRPVLELVDSLGLLLYPELLKSIEKEYTEFYGEAPTQEQKDSPMFYVRNRMLAPMRESLEMEREKDSLSQEEPLSSLEKQWKLEKKVISVPRSNKEFFSDSSLFELPEGSFSPITLSGAGEGKFFHLLSRQEAEAPSLEEANMLLAPLQREAEAQLSKKLLREIEAKGGFYLDRRR